MKHVARCKLCKTFVKKDTEYCKKHIHVAEQEADLKLDFWASGLYEKSEYPKIVETSELGRGFLSLF